MICFSWSRGLLCLAACLMLVGSSGLAEAAQASSAARASLGGVAFDERLDREPVLLPALPRSTADLPPLVVRVAFDLSSTRS